MQSNYRALILLAALTAVVAREPLFKVPIVVRGSNQIIDIFAGDDAYIVARAFCERQGVGLENADLIVQEILRHLETYNQQRNQQQARPFAPKGAKLFDFAGVVEHNQPARASIDISCCCSQH